MGLIKPRRFLLQNDDSVEIVYNFRFHHCQKKKRRKESNKVIKLCVARLMVIEFHRISKRVTRVYNFLHFKGEVSREFDVI